MNSTSELKRQAKSQLKSRWGLAIGGFFIAVLFFPFILSIINFFAGKYGSFPIKTIIYLFTLILNILLLVGTVKFSLNYASIGKTPFLDDIFSGFKVFVKALCVNIIMMISITLGFVLLIVPGIIVGLMFSQALYILMDDNSKSAIDCLKESVNIMKGHKLEFFILSLSFLGWILLMIAPLFVLIYFPLPMYFLLLYVLILLIGLLLLIPYINVTFAIFYLKVKNSYYGIIKE